MSSTPGHGGRRVAQAAPRVPEAEHLLSAIEAFCARTGIPVTAFGRIGFGDPRFVLDLRLGRMPRRPARLRASALMALWGGERWRDRPRHCVGRDRTRSQRWRLVQADGAFCLEPAA